MASGFWYLKDDRGFSRKIQTMIVLLEEIHSELQLNAVAMEFAGYLSQYLPTSQHEINGYGGFYHTETGENIMMVIDLREFTQENQSLFWRATQLRTNKLIKEDNKHKAHIISMLKELLDMNKRAHKGEAPKELNHLKIIEPPTGLQNGPGWVEQK